MSTRTHFTGITKRIALTDGVVKEFVFNDPNDANAFKTKSEDSGSDLVVNQTFNKILLSNLGNRACIFTFKKGIIPPSGNDNLFILMPLYKMFLELGFDLIKLYSSGGSGIIYMTLFSETKPTQVSPIYMPS